MNKIKHDGGGDDDDDDDGDDDDDDNMTTFLSSRLLSAHLSKNKLLTVVRSEL